MRILEVNSFFTVGGPPRIMNGIYDTLKDNHFDCKIAAAREAMYAPGDSIPIGSDLSVKINAVKARISDNEGFNGYAATVRLIRQIKEYNPDVIHLHNLHGYYLQAETLFDFLKEFGKPVVWTLHDCWAFTGHCAYFDYAGCSQWQTGCDKCLFKDAYPKSVLANRAGRNYKKKKQAFTGVKNLTIVTPSYWLADLVKQSFLSEYPVKVIKNGINTKVFKPVDAEDTRKKFGINHDDVLILGVAQVWDRRKGMDFFIDLREMLPSNFKVILVGMDKKQTEKLPEGIIGLGKTNSVQELVQLYSAADVYVNPTLEDNYPTTNLEAIACGTPVVTFPTGGSPETIIQGYGMVTKEKTAAALLNAINDVRKIGKKACDVCEMDSAERYWEYIELFKGIVL